MRILITGGAGFIGGHLTEHLLALGHDVMVIDNFSTGSRANLAAVQNHPALTVIEGDILTSPDLAREMKRADFCYHLAAAVGVELVVNDPVRTIVTNVHGTESVLHAADVCKTPCLIASTSEVYGKSAKAVFSETDDLLIGPSTHSRWSYACSKLLDEFFTMAYVRDRQLPGRVVRLFNTVGPRQTGQYGMVVPRFVRAALRNEPLRVYGDGAQSRCFCHVLDVVEALIGLQTPQAVGHVYNIGSTQSITILELAHLVIDVLHSQSTIEMIPYEEAYEAGFEDMRRRKPDTCAVESLLNWQVKRSLRAIIEDTAAAMTSGSAAWNHA